MFQVNYLFVLTGETIKNNRLILKETSDGSHTLYVPGIDEHYHSMNGAAGESIHIFINSGLNSLPGEKISLFEVGFGTGLNAFLTAIYCEKQGKRVHYTTIEKYPLEKDDWSQLNYPYLFDGKYSELFIKLHEAEWESDQEISEWFTLRKLKADLLNYDPEGLFDLVYFDAFGPEKQPGMWTEEIITKVASAISNGGIFVTYSARGSLRRALQSCGFATERLPGPPGKREFTRATRNTV